MHSDEDEIETNAEIELLTELENNSTIKTNESSKDINQFEGSQTNQLDEIIFVDRPNNFVTTGSTLSFTMVLGKISSAIIFLFRSVLASIANFSILLSIGILYSLYILVIGSLFYGIYYTITGKSDDIKSLNEAIQWVAEITISGIGKLFSGLGKMFETMSSSPFWQIVLISVFLIISLNHLFRVGFGGLNSVSKKKGEIIIKITRWAFEPLGLMQIKEEKTKETDYNEMTVTEIKELLKEAGLPVSGNKADLITRLQERAETSATAEVEFEEDVSISEEE